MGAAARLVSIQLTSFGLAQSDFFMLSLAGTRRCHVPSIKYLSLSRKGHTLNSVRKQLPWRISMQNLSHSVRDLHPGESFLARQDRPTLPFGTGMEKLYFVGSLDQ
jgi:hypothetical protein